MSSVLHLQDCSSEVPSAHQYNADASVTKAFVSEVFAAQRAHCSITLDEALIPQVLQI